jgi:undecaprenyl-diphosphatase
MIETLIEADRWLFLQLNGLHLPLLDPVMVFVSGRFGWIPFYLLILAGLIKHKRWETITILIFTFLLISFSDQLSVWIKMQTARPRPCHEPDLQPLIHSAGKGCGGQFGFVSSHAANTFALALWISKLLKPHWPKIVIVMFSWAALVSYSRIYLGVHYPGDLLAGAAIGLLCSWITWRIYALLPCKTTHRLC